MLDKICDDRGWITGPDDLGNCLPLVTVVSGGARGADRLAEDWAVTRWCPLEVYPADWETHGKSAGYIRNKEMLEKGRPDIVVAFPGGKGTFNMVNIAKKAGVEVIEVV